MALKQKQQKEICETLVEYFHCILFPCSFSLPIPFTHIFTTFSFALSNNSCYIVKKQPCFDATLHLSKSAINSNLCTALIRHGAQCSTCLYFTQHSMGDEKRNCTHTKIIKRKTKRKANDGISESRKEFDEITVCVDPQAKYRWTEMWKLVCLRTTNEKKNVSRRLFNLFHVKRFILVVCKSDCVCMCLHYRFSYTPSASIALVVKCVWNNLFYLLKHYRASNRCERNWMKWEKNYFVLSSHWWKGFVAADSIFRLLLCSHLFSGRMLHEIRARHSIAWPQ